jgi:hypothetical protein
MSYYKTIHPLSRLPHNVPYDILVEKYCKLLDAYNILKDKVVVLIQENNKLKEQYNITKDINYNLPINDILDNKIPTKKQQTTNGLIELSKSLCLLNHNIKKNSLQNIYKGINLMSQKVLNYNNKGINLETKKVLIFNDKSINLKTIKVSNYNDKGIELETLKVLNYNDKSIELEPKKVLNYNYKSINLDTLKSSNYVYKSYDNKNKDILKKLSELKQSNKSYKEMSDILNNEQYFTTRGGYITKSVVQNLLRHIQ